MRCPQTPNGTRHRPAGTQPTQLSSCFAGTTFSGSGDSKPRWGCWKHTGPSSSHSNSKRVVKDRTEASLQRQRTQGPGSPESRHQALASTTVAGGTALPHRGWDRGVRLLHRGALRCRRGKSFPHRAAAFSTGAEGQQARGQRKEGLCHQGPPPGPCGPPVVPHSPLTLETPSANPRGATYLLSLLRLSIGCWYCPFILLSLLEQRTVRQYHVK